MASDKVPVCRLRKDSQTVRGSTWSCFATPDEARRIRRGRLRDVEGVLGIGDVVYVKPAQTGAFGPFGLRIVERADDVVTAERV